MPIRKLDKNLVGNIVIFVSIVLVILCFAAVMVSQPMQSDEVEWDGYHYFIPGGLTTAITEDSFIISSPYESQNIEFIKTNDSTNFTKHFGNIVGDYYTDRNVTHTLFVDEDDCFAAIVAKDSYEDNNGGVELKGNPEIIEIHGNDIDFMNSLIYSSYR